MKRLLSMILTGLMLFSAACTAAPKPQNAEAPTDPPAQTLQPTEWPFPSDEDLFAPEVTSEPDHSADEPTQEPAETPEPYDVTSDAGFAFALAAKLLNGKENRNLSPISVYLAMAMVTEGANGDTQTELLKLLGCNTIEELRAVCAALLETLSIDDEHSTLDLNNSLWMAKEIGGQPVEFRKAFLKTLGETYRSEANTVDFKKRTAGLLIAEWITKQTRGKIEISPDAMQFDPETLAVLINTIYLKDVWGEPFDPLKTESGVFYGLDSEITVDYMHRFDRNVTIDQGDGWLRYRVYLKEVGYISFILPDEGITLGHLLSGPEAIEKLLHAGIPKACDVSLMLPKFSFQDKTELEAVLAAMGLNLSFTDAADFSGMSDVPCRIDRVLQESYIGVDENGVEAAAYTMVAIRAGSAFNPVEREKIEFHLTRPFLYAIESRDGTLLFIGTVTAPTESTAPVTIHK